MALWREETMEAHIPRLGRRCVSLYFIIAVLGVFASTGRAGTIATFNTSLGSFDAQLFDDTAPGTVANFLNYVNDGDYTNSFFHRLAYGFVLQGGGFRYIDGYYYYVPPDDPIENEYNQSNVRGTMAMAKTDAGPDSATCQFFVNLGDNSANLDNQNGGFTVFGYVLGDGMKVVDRLAGFPPNDANVGIWDVRDIMKHPAFGQLPMIDYPNGVPFAPYLEMVYSITARESPAPGDIDGDGDVDVSDYLTLKQHLGTESGASWAWGDFDNDQDVDRADLLLMMGYLSGTSGEAPASGGGVPEPATLALLAIGGLALIRRRRP